MTEHQLKTWPDHFRAVMSGKKTLEIRRDDREPRFAEGDVLHLCEWDPASGEYTSAELRRRVTHVLPGGQFGLAEGFVALSIALADAGQS